jgi:hypothetical protein
MIQCLHAKVLQGFPEPKRSIVRSFSQFRGKILASVPGCRIRKLWQRGPLEKRGSECVKWISCTSVAGPSEGKPPGVDSLGYPTLSQSWQDASPNQRRLSRAFGAQQQQKGPFIRHLLPQNVEHFSDDFRSAVEKRSMFSIKELQSAKRVHFA